MSELSARILAKKKGRIVAIIVSSLLVIISGLIVTLSFLHEKKVVETPSLTVISCDNRVYYGGDFRIQAAYKYEDGRIEYPSSNAIKYESAESIVSIDSDGNVKVVEDIYNGNTDYQEHPVVISISSSNKNVDSIQVSIKVVPVYTYSITKYYYDESTLELKSELVPAWQGQTVDEITNPSLPNYSFENWYVESIGDEPLSTSMAFYAEDKYLWGDKISIKPKFYADLQFNVDDMSIEEVAPASVKVYFDEPITNAFPTLSTNSHGWAFAGWYTGLSGAGDENGVQNGVFRAVKPILYAKWSGIATLNLTQIIHNDDNEGIISRVGTVGTFSSNTEINVPVIYHGAINLSTSQIPTYSDGGEFAGWYTEQYGAGTQITNEHGEGIFNSISLQLYDKIVFTVNIDYNAATGNYDEGHTEFTATYGTVVDFVGNGLGRNPTKTGWDFDGWKVVYGSDSIPVSQNMQYSLLGDIDLVAQWKWELELNSDIDTYILDQSSTTFFYGEEKNIDPINDWGSWAFDGWYTQRAGEGRLIEKTTDYENTGVKVLYAKWVLHKLTLNTVTPQITEYRVINDADIIYGKTIESALGYSLPIPETPRGYSNGLGWFNGADDNAEQISNSRTIYPQVMDILYYRWSPRTDIPVTLNHNAGTATVTNAYNGIINATMGEPLENLSNYIPEKPLYTFLGYYYDDENKLYYGADMTGWIPWDLVPAGNESIVLTALWGEPCTITLDPVIQYDSNYADQEGTKEVKVRFNSPMTSGPTAPKRAGYTFDGYYDQKDGQGDKYYNADMTSAKVWDKNVTSATLYAKWIPNAIKASSTSSSLSMSDSGAIATTTISGSNGSGKYTFAVTSTNHPNLNTPTVDGNGKLTLKTSGNADNSGTVVVTVTDSRTGEKTTCSIGYTTSKVSSCVAKGTLFWLPDGSSIAVENLSINDTILAFDHTSGTYVETKVLYTYYGFSEVTSIELFFSNNVSVEFLNVGHGLFDITLNKYVLINEETVNDYVEHEFLYTVVTDGVFTTASVRLSGYVISQKLVERYDIVTEGTLNHIANGLVACSDTLVGICNMFEFASDYTYDEIQLALDIEKYGLYTYDEWSEYLSYDDFVAFNGAYFKIAVGKGLITIEEIFSLLNDLLECRS